MPFVELFATRGGRVLIGVFRVDGGFLRVLGGGVKGF